MQLTTVFIAVIFFALLNCAGNVLLHTWGFGGKTFHEWYGLYRKKWMPSHECDFCILFWASFIELLICYAWTIRVHILSFETTQVAFIFALSLCCSVLSRFFCQKQV